MPSWSDDEGRCHYTVNGTPCYMSEVGCPMHLAPSEVDTLRAELRDLRMAAKNLLSKTDEYDEFAPLSLFYPLLDALNEALGEVEK